MLSKEEGGRNTPFFNGYRPQCYFRTAEVSGALAAGGHRNGHAGRQHDHDDRTHGPDRHREEKLRFAVREGGRTVGAGTITEIVE